MEQLREVLTPISTSLPTEGSTRDNAHIRWIENSQQRFDELIESSFGNITNSPFKLGFWKAAYTLNPPISDLALSQLSDKIHLIEGRESGWPIGLILSEPNSKPYPYNECVEVWLAETHTSPDICDFWRASPSGEFVTIRGYQEDSSSWKGGPPGSTLEFIIPIWRVGELLLHAQRFAREFSSGECSANVSITWTGLNNRKLITTSGLFLRPIERQAHQDKVDSSIFIEDALSIDVRLPELVDSLTRPLYETFDFFKMPKESIIKQLNEMRGIR